MNNFQADLRNLNSFPLLSIVALNLVSSNYLVVTSLLDPSVFTVCRRVSITATGEQEILNELLSVKEVIKNVLFRLGKRWFAGGRVSYFSVLLHSLNVSLVLMSGDGGDEEWFAAFRVMTIFPPQLHFHPLDIFSSYSVWSEGQLAFPTNQVVSFL